jgi:peroxiredoxin Q/BCP
MLSVGSIAPDFIARNQEGKEIRLGDLLGKVHIVLFFFPKDNTPGWTVEARGFRDLYDEFKKKNVVIFGVSLESEASHRKFRSKQLLPFDLLVDPELKLCKLYDVSVIHLIFLKLAARVTYVIDMGGTIKAAFESVSPNGHAQQILALF